MSRRVSNPAAWVRELDDLRDRLAACNASGWQIRFELDEARSRLAKLEKVREVTDEMIAAGLPYAAMLKLNTPAMLPKDRRHEKNENYDAHWLAAAYVAMVDAALQLETGPVAHRPERPPVERSET